MDTKELDKIVNVAVINYFSLGKNNPKLCLYNINVRDERHLAGIHIAKLIKDIYGYEFFLPRDLFAYWDISWKCRSRKWLKPVKGKLTNCVYVDMEDFISHIEKANEMPGAFREVYKEYFKTFDR